MIDGRCLYSSQSYRTKIKRTVTAQKGTLQAHGERNNWDGKETIHLHRLKFNSCKLCGNRNRFSLHPHYLKWWGRRGHLFVGEVLVWHCGLRAGHLYKERALIWGRVLIRVWVLILRNIQFVTLRIASTSSVVLKSFLSIN